MQKLLNEWRAYLQEGEKHISDKEFYHGSKIRFSNWDLSEVKEFGFHFGKEKKAALHRINEQGYVYKAKLSYNKPISMPDLLRWNLDNVLRHLDFSKDKIRDKKKEASKVARKNETSMRVEENLLLAKILDDMGYDAIEYKNEGEDKGDAVIVWQPQQINVLKVLKV
jgi:hypothetical protein